MRRSADDLRVTATPSSADPLPSLPPLREVINRYGLTASKALGQNFLLDRQLLDRIARVAGALEGESVYEVGPGPGGLTRSLLAAGAQVVAVERDGRCKPALDDLAAAYPGRLRIIDADAMTIDEPAEAGPGSHVVANLPYNVGTALLVRWLSVEPWPPWWKSLTLMFQKEVADRVVAKPDTSAYGRLAVLAQWRSQAQIAFGVHRSAFVPPPKVMSAVVHIEPRPAPQGVRLATLERITGAAFGQRRKMLRQSLKSVSGAIDALDGLGIDPTRRAETLTVEDYIALARVLEAA